MTTSMQPMPITMKGWANLAAGGLNPKYPADFTLPSLWQIDFLFDDLGHEWCDRIWICPQNKELGKHFAIHAIAAYVGEVVVRSAGGKWDDESSGTLLDKTRSVGSPKGKIQPIAIVIEKLEKGKSMSLARTVAIEGAVKVGRQPKRTEEYLHRSRSIN